MNPSAEAEAAFAAGDYVESYALLIDELRACEADFPQADECLDLNFIAADIARRSGNPEAGETLGRKAIELALATLGDAHPDTATVYIILALNLDAQGRHADAEPLFRQALEIRQKALGEAHLDTVTVSNRLAINLDAQGRYADAESLLRRALEIRRLALGEADLGTVNGYLNLAINLSAQGRYADAEPLFRQALEITQKALGEAHLDTVTVSNRLAINLDAQGRYTDAETLHRRALEIWLKTFGETHAHTATGYNNVARNLLYQGRFTDSETLYRNALKIWLKTLGEAHPDTALSYSGLASTLDAQGRYTDAETLHRRALEIWLKTLGEVHPYTANGYNNLATNQISQGRHADAESLLRKALEIRQTVQGEQHPDTALSYSSLATNLDAQGRYADAEPLHRRALEIWLNTLGEAHPDTANGYNGLALNLNARGHHTDAEPLFRKALEIHRATLGELHPTTANSYNFLALNMNAQGRYADAEPLIRQALEIRQKALGEAHPLTAESFNNVGANLHAQGRYVDADQMYRHALEIRLETLGETHRDTANSYNNLAVNLSSQGHYADAELLHRQALAIAQEVWGETHRETAWRFSDLAYTFLNLGDAVKALSHARRAVSIVRRQQVQAQQAQAGQLSGDDDNDTSRHIYATLLEAAWIGTQDPDLADTPDTLMNEAFAAAQDLLANGTEVAVTQMAARFAAGDDGLAQLSRQHQDAARELAATDSLILTAWGEGNQDKAENLRTRSAALAEQLDALSSDLRDRYPSYAELVLPVPLSVLETQASLGDGQGLLLIAPWGNRTYVFALTANAAKWQRVGLSWSELSGRVARLRCDVDPVTCSEEGADGTRAGASAYGQSVSQGLRPFDRSTAHSLYKDVLLPVMDVFEDVDSLSVVTSGPLSGIPLSIFVTEEPGAGEDDADPEVLRNTAWLGDRFALMSLPSVSSLKSLGGVSGPSDARREVFVGVGDPLLGGELVAGVSRSGLDQYFRGVSDAGTALANPDSLRQLASLPGTRSELEAMASALGATEESLLLGKAATETAVKARSLSTEVLTFATHGLIAGELRGLGEPGLVLTPPEVATEHDDGILTASEIARLDLDVEWLILSACNTASADGTPGAEGLSGLARAFLYAGARSLLVSHWRVRDDVTAKLTVAAIKGSENQSRSKSLQQAMRSIRTGTDENGEAIPGWDPSWSHPAAWAPFSLVGARQ